MKPEIKLFFDFEFTSLSPDAQPISLGIVSEDYRYDSFKRWKVTGIGEVPKEDIFHYSKSFYSEFTDFDLNRCDDWVKENVVGKLKFYPKVGDSNKDGLNPDANPFEVGGDFEHVKYSLKEWLSQFSDYNIQFVCDCGTFDFYWMLQLLAEWKTYNIEEKQCNKCGWIDEGGYNTNFTYKSGLPKLPENISPVPQDLNDLIALKKGISVKEAFDWNRLQFYFGIISGHSDSKKYEQAEIEIKNNHNALFDAKVIKAIYEKLK